MLEHYFRQQRLLPFEYLHLLQQVLAVFKFPPLAHVPVAAILAAGSVETVSTLKPFMALYSDI
jgi:hypothetical protein